LKKHSNSPPSTEIQEREGTKHIAKEDEDEDEEDEDEEENGDEDEYGDEDEDSDDEGGQHWCSGRTRRCGGWEKCCRRAHRR
jgi:hypothetical protein